MSTNRRTNTENVVHVHIEFYSAVEKNEMLPFAGKWMELERIMLNKRPLL